VAFEELEDGHLRLHVPEGVDMSDVFERVPFDEVETDEDR
jgi:hypothetical protein